MVSLCQHLKDSKHLSQRNSNLREINDLTERTSNEQTVFYLEYMFKGKNKWPCYRMRRSVGQGSVQGIVSVP